MESFAWVLGPAIVIFVLYKLYSGFKEGVAGSDGKMHCMNCGTEAEPKTNTRGSMGMEIILWLCFLVPGLIYSIWRLNAKEQVCPACKSNKLIPTNTPNAIAHRNSLKG